MDGQTIFYIAIIAVPFLCLAVYGIFSRPKVLTGPATVESHNLETAKFGSAWSHGWNYMIRFRLADGESLELYVTLEEYQTIEDGQTGMLSWDRDQLMDFIPDIT